MCRHARDTAHCVGARGESYVQYIDTSSRDPAHALGSWLAGLSTQDITDFRFQSGYFTAKGLAPLARLFPFLCEHNLPTTCVLGSNGGETDPQDVNILLDFVGCPRTHARIAIVAYTTGLYHPKVYHTTRADGSQAAYVGSANLTSPGISGLNIEAGIVLDTADGDPEPPLAEIVSTMDTWFCGAQDGVHLVDTRDDGNHQNLWGQATTRSIYGLRHRQTSSDHRTDPQQPAFRLQDRSCLRHNSFTHLPSNEPARGTPWHQPLFDPTDFGGSPCSSTTSPPRLAYSN